MAQLKIRRFKKSDNKAVWNLHILGLEQFTAYLGGKWDKDLDNIEKVYLKNGDFIVGEINKKVIAMGAFKKISKNIAEIKRIRIHPDYQRKGFGQVILVELEKRSAKLGYNILQLDTTNKQIPAQRFFEKNGYVMTKSKPLKKFDLDMIYYEKKLR
jgi:N-acetylglutamate synthase-like GNAT family acetyltransferase